MIIISFMYLKCFSSRESISAIICLVSGFLTGFSLEKKSYSRESNPTSRALQKLSRVSTLAEFIPLSIRLTSLGET